VVDKFYAPARGAPQATISVLNLNSDESFEFSTSPLTPLPALREREIKAAPSNGGRGNNGD